MLDKLRTRIMILSDGYLPGKNYGGPVTSLKNLVDNCSDKFEFYIITSDRDLNCRETYKGIKDGLNSVGRAKVFYLSNDNFSKSYLETIFNSIKPKLIYQNSFFSYKSFILSNYFSNKLRIPILIAPRGELCNGAYNLKITKKKIYTKLVNQYLKLNKRVFFHSTSDEETNAIIKRINILRNNVIQIKNISSGIYENGVASFKEEGKLNLIFLSRIQVKKNLKYAIKIVNQIKNVEITFDIYGPIENKKYWDECKILIKKSPKNINIKYSGQVDQQDVKATFSRYHAFFFPTFSENYGHVIVEAMQASCIMILSDQTPWNDINNSGGGFALSLSSTQEYVDVLNHLGWLNNQEFQLLKQKNIDYVNKKIDDYSVVRKYYKYFQKLADKT